MESLVQGAGVGDDGSKKLGQDGVQAGQGQSVALETQRKDDVIQRPNEDDVNVDAGM